MGYLLLVASLFFIFGEVLFRRTATRRAQAVMDRIRTRHGEAFVERFGDVSVGEPKFKAFLESAEDFGDAELANLKQQALRANRRAWWPLLGLLFFFAAAYMLSALLALLK